MADLFNNYEADLIEVLTNLGNHIRAIPTLGTPELRQSEVKKAEASIKEAEELLSSMNLNVRNVPGPQQPRLQQKVREYEVKVVESKKELKRSQAMVDRETLIGNAAILGGGDLSTSLDQRERLLDQTERLGRSTQTLRDAKRTALGTLETGAIIMDNLASQRQTMEASIAKTETIGEQLTRSSKLLGAMARRMVTNKLIMAVIVVVLLGAIALVVWLKWFNN